LSVYKKGDEKKCENYHGISLIDVAAKVFTIFLLRRFQSVGAILSSRLFSLHNDDLRSANDCLYIKYADDMVVGHPLNNQTHLQCLMDGLDSVSAWSSDNGLQLNHEKSVQCVFHLRPSPSSESSAVLPNEVSSFRYLGVTLTFHLSFSQHI
uniref:Reverse transcriptase domain-containing protein n=1 Tax=Schistocephalus solidus TaxID=70667 RepID=A0A183TLQ8_SCHSO